MTRESRVWQWINTHTPPHIHIERLEVLYPPGLADCFWSVTGTRPCAGWLELKYCEESDKEFRAGRIPKLRLAQPIFLNRQARNNVPSGIVLRVGEFRWYLWRADGTPGWVSFINSTEAIGSPSVGWIGKGPASTAEILGCLL